jgi:hypothetical protein
MITTGYGLLMGLIGCAVTVVGFFVAFLVVNHNGKKQKQKEEEAKSRPHGFYGDDTV